MAAPPLVIAHRGDSAHRPENTLAAFAGALEVGAALVELDVQLTADGHVIVLHDADLVICVGQSELDKAKKALPHDRLAYLPNGVDSAKFASGDGPGFRSRHGLPQEAFLAILKVDN